METQVINIKKEINKIKGLEFFFMVLPLSHCPLIRACFLDPLRHDLSDKGLDNNHKRGIKFIIKYSEIYEHFNYAKFNYSSMLYQQ